jgi:hypothetical protein
MPRKIIRVLLLAAFSATVMAAAAAPVVLADGVGPGI